MTSSKTPKKENPLDMLIATAITLVLALPSWLGLSLGAAVVVTCERMPGQAGGQPAAPSSRVNVTVRQKILGLVTWKEDKLADVTEASASSKTVDNRDSRGRKTSSYSARHLQLKTRGGQEWRSPEAAFAFGDLPGEMAPAIKDFIEKSSEPSLKMWWMNWLANLVGLPFAILFLLFAFGLFMGLAKKALGIKSPPGRSAA